MTIALPVPTMAVPAAWRAHLSALAAVAAAILLLFRRDVAELVDIWWTSTTYGHCLFIAPVVAWLVWTRRGELAQLCPMAWWPGLALVAAGGAGWLLGEAAGAAFARQLGLVMMLQGAVVTLLGPHVARGIAFPLGYALFMVPFGEWLEPPLQAITVAMVMPLLHLVGVPAAVDGVLIHAGRYYFEVAEACSGSKFVLSMAAYGVLVANVCFRSARRRAIFLVVALIIPVLANGVRAFATIWAAELTSLEAATGFDHIVYGWIFFAFVMIAVMAVGWRWFDRAPDDAAFDPATLPPPRRHRVALLPAAIGAVLLAALFPAWSAAIAGRSQPLPAALAAPVVPGWTRIDPRTSAPWRPSYPAADRQLFARYVDSRGNAVDLALALFAAQHEGKEVVAYGTGVLRAGDRWLRVADLPAIDGGAVMRITAVGAAGTPVERVVATWYRVGGIVTDSPTIVKLATLKARLIGGEPGAVALHLSAERLAGRDPAAAIARFRAALGPIDQATARALR
ncbi:exosortase A [Sphingomonas sp. NBWT7]|uniref:exosortase A n=1 Tax=Sphingomonas sp. NBWT7 TaxID=2596913 RepID=UPI001623526B|nr:exosortase A [Sphingomonas sp. NBWT7]QNE30721.1 exosortase A [Sphingomonas sp. NBWT7]